MAHPVVESEVITESVLADRRHAMLDILGRLLPSPTHYVLAVSEGPVKLVDGELRSEFPIRYEIREFADVDPESENAYRLTHDAEGVALGRSAVYEFAIKRGTASGMLVLTDTKTGYARYRLTLNRGIAGKLITGA